MSESWKNWEGHVADGQFQLRRLLGATDRSAVFLTEAPAQESQIAGIKFIPADPDAGEIQLTRWRLAARLSHPHLARIFASGRCLLGPMSLLYVVMEHAEEDLSQIIPQRALTQAEVRELLPPLLDTLAYLHAEGFVHNRLKPANIMAVGDQLKISSDGVRRAAKSGASQSRPGPYDAPEAATGVISPAGDVWSLGMTLVEILTQRLPVWEHFGDGDPSLPDALPASFLDLAHHCLRRDPTFRWTAADITHWLNSAAVRAPQPQIAIAQPVNSATAPGAQPVAQQPAKTPPRMFANWRYVIPVGAMAMVIFAMLAGPRLFNRRMEAQPAPMGASKHGKPRSEPQPDPQARSGSVAEMSVESHRVSTSATQPGSQPASSDAPKSGDVAHDSSAGSPAAPKASTTPAPTPAAFKSDRATKAANASLVPAQVLEQALPEVSSKARDTIQGTVRVSVRVQVDPAGTVLGATLDSPAASKYFSEQALHAAPRWKFFPATRNGENVASEWILRFEFTSAGTKVRPSEVTP